MLLFIGGAARTGKGILARRLLTQWGWPYLSLDVLKMGLTRGLPEFGIDPDAGATAVAAHLWPLVREMSHSLLRDGTDYVFEGELLPRDVASMRDAFPSSVRACFLGYDSIEPEQKLREVRSHAGHPNDWPQERTDDSLRAIIAREIAFSRYLRVECTTYGFPYFDTSQHFLQTQDEVLAFVRAE